jgi:hypothetical protein
MTWAWTAWLDEVWRAPAFPVWMTLVVAAIAVLALLAALLRAEQSVAGTALAVVALLAIAVAAVTVLRGAGAGGPAVAAVAAPEPVAVALPALACLDELAGDTVQAACERVLFGAPDHVAAAVSHVAAQIDRLAAATTVTAATGVLRNALQRDRYGLAAYVLTTRNGCTVTACPLLRVFADPSRIVANMTARTYEALVARHMPAWTALGPSAAVGNETAAELPPSVPTGRPTTIDFPTAASIPPISIMSGEPARPAAPQTAPAAPPEASATARAPAPPHPRPAPPSAKRQPKSAPAAPVQLAPAASGGDNR